MMRAAGLARRPFLNRRKLILSLLVLVIVGTMWGIAYWAVNMGGYQPARIAWKRLRAASVYTYDEIDPRFLQVDPRSLITIRTRDDVPAKRDALIAAVFGPGGYPSARRPDRIERNIAMPELGTIESLEAIDRLDVRMDLDIVKPSFLMRPKRPNGTLVLYQHGYAGTFIQVRDKLQVLLDKGYTVLAMNLLSYDANGWAFQKNIPGVGWIYVGPHDLPSFVDNALRFWFEPAVAAMNYALATGGFQHVYMIGFSMGGWMTQILSAMAPQIERSYSIAGGYPLYLRSQEPNELPPPVLFGPLVRAASYLDMYVLAADRPGRRQVQIFNRYDRCCYRNKKGLLYEAAVVDAIAKIGGGYFDVDIDETHADHKISDRSMAFVLNDMAVQ
jgi:pimeloyl-ACP methyl ester carboxylesterase